MMDYIKDFKDYLNKALINYDLAGLTVGVWVNNDSPLEASGLSFGEAFGKADVKKDIDLKPEHYSHMASISKTLTACAALKLWEESKLSFDDKLCDLLPWIRIDDGRTLDITFKHIITHTSGLPAVDDFAWTKPDVDSNALKRYAKSDDVKKASFVNTPGENNFSYSDMGYEILGNIIQEVSGVEYEKYIADNLLRPLSMDNSTMLVYERTEPGRSMDPDTAAREEIDKALAMEELLKSGLAMPHMKDKQNHIIRQPYYPYNRRHAPSSTLNANIFDLKKWGDAHMTKSFMNQDTYSEMWKRQTTVPNNGEGMGLGWFLREQNGYTLYGHEGMDDGFRASFWICPEIKTQIIVLANIGKAPVKKISKTLFDKLTI